MANNIAGPAASSLKPIRLLILGYLGLMLATLIALGILTAVAPTAAGVDAWVHAVIVAAFAGLLLLRLRAALHGSRGAVRAVAVIAVALLIAIGVEACISVFPTWMRVEMIIIAVLMLIIAVLVVRELRHDRGAAGSEHEPRRTGPRD